MTKPSGRFINTYRINSARYHDMVRSSRLPWAKIERRQKIFLDRNTQGIN
jgi:hypothetical protein